MRKFMPLLFLLLLITPTFAQDEEPVDWADSYYAPYVYMARYPVFRLTDIAEATGLRYFTLAFILGNTRCEAGWFGTVPLENSYISNFLIPDLESLRAMGGDVIISFGGASGTELAQVCTDVESLTAQYQAVIDAYGVTHLDFDIEADEIGDRESLERRSEAIALLQANNAAEGRELFISFTLPVNPTGLTDDGLSVLEAANDAGVQVDVVNIMTMNFGTDYPGDEMGEGTIQAAESLYAQLESLYPELSEEELWGTIGLTPMVGMNDRQRQIFDLDDAEMVTDFALEQGIRLIAIWSLDRDQPCEFVNSLANDCSGYDQEPNAFSQILNRLTGDVEQDE